ncbi:MAG TPA: cytochrome c-type biogenesis protein, partial [Rheinheimera sp.]|nr:cytochrome c-type biogenesis protein [Rheinheimera sp.]
MNRLYCLLALLFSLTAPAQEVLQFDNEAQRQLYQQLTAELRCPQCQNQNIADSHAVVAVDMRQKTYQLIREGKDRQQVLEYMINRYGDFVHYLPPVNRYT